MKKTVPCAVAKICLILFFFSLYPPQNSCAIRLVYTIQTGSFYSSAAAQRQFDSMVQRFNEEELHNLRIEKIGEIYSVRLGKFKDYTIAEKFIEAMKPKLSKAIIVKAYIKDERIIKLYKGFSLVGDSRVKEESLSSPVPKQIGPKVSDKDDKKIKTKISPAVHEKRGDNYLKNHRYLLAIEEYRQAIKQGANDPQLYWKLALALYEIKFLDDAIIEMEKAVALSYNADGYRIALGAFYLAKGRLEKAKELFFTVLHINPAYAIVYYYLGELFIRTGDYDMAWLSVKMAKRLGIKGQDVIRKLSVLSREPNADPWNVGGEEFYIRQILVDTYDKAQDIVKRIAEGELFEDIAFRESIGPNASRGGFMGHVKASAIDPHIADALLDREVLADPVIVKTEKGFHIVQRIVPFNFNSWEKLLANSDRYNY